MNRVTEMNNQQNSKSAIGHPLLFTAHKDLN